MSEENIFQRSIKQSFGWGCGCLIFICVLFFILTTISVIIQSNDKQSVKNQIPSKRIIESNYNNIGQAIVEYKPVIQENIQTTYQEEYPVIPKIEIKEQKSNTLKLKGNATAAYGNPDASKVYNPISPPKKPPIQIEYQTFEEINRQYTQPYVQNNNYGENHRTAYEMQRIDPAPPGQQWINGYRNKYGTWVNPYLRSIR